MGLASMAFRHSFGAAAMAVPARPNRYEIQAKLIFIRGAGIVNLSRLLLVAR